MPIATSFLLSGGAAFPQSSWDPDHFATVVLAEFIKGGGWDTMLAAANVPAQAVIDDELLELAQLVYYRPSVLAEAMAQDRAILPYFSGILDFNLRSRPATVYLCAVALRVGSFQAMHYKYTFDRPRPSRLSPQLIPPFGPPGHPSFPSGHATQARLVALCLEQVMPAAIIPVDNQNVPQPEDGPLRRMAARIARNREVVGLHYRSDTVAGNALADETFAKLVVVQEVVDLITVARTEWA
jgi:hypothetical protein